MKQVFFGGAGQPSTSATNYSPFFSNATAWGATDVGELIPAAGTLRNLAIDLDVAPGSGKSYVFTLRKNGSDTALTVTISDASTTGILTGTDVSVSAGDLISLKCVPSGTPATARVRRSVEFQPTTSTTFVTVSGTNDTLNSSGTREYAFIAPNYGNTWTSTESDRRFVVPINCTLTGLYATLSVAPGTSNSYTFSVYKNGAQEASSVVAISNASTSGSVTGLSIDLAPGDVITLSTIASGSPGTPIAYYGLVFQPDTDGEYMVGNCGVTGAFNDTTDNYHRAGAAGASSTEAVMQALIRTSSLNVTATALAIDMATAPGSGKTRTFYLRKDGTSSSLSVAVSGSNTSGTATGSVAFSDDLINILHTPTSTPTVSRTSMSVGLYTETPVTTSTHTVDTLKKKQTTSTHTTDAYLGTLPTVTTDAASSIAATTASGNGNITVTGGTVTLRGFVLSTSTHGDPGNVAPASSGYSIVSTESGSFSTGAYALGISGLSATTTYYCRAVVYNGIGYDYGGEVSFTTTATPNYGRYNYATYE